MDIKTIEDNIRKEATVVMTRLMLFILYYIVLIAFGASLFVGAFYVSCWLWEGIMSLISFNLRAFFLVLIIWSAMWWFCISFAWFLFKPLFASRNSRNDNYLRVKKGDCPDLFEMIREVATATGNKMPWHVYLSADANACVFYPSSSFWAIFVPMPKNLMLGIGLLQNMNRDEVKAILSHEFGHFSQSTMKVGSACYRLLLIISDMIALAKEMKEDADEHRSESTYRLADTFYLAVIPAGWFTKLSINFYNYIEKENRRLSRLMEFEADAVACRIVGAKPFISSMYKLNTVSEHFHAFDNTIVKFVSEKRALTQYWQGYQSVDQFLFEQEGHKFNAQTILTDPFEDKEKFTSKILVQDGWNTHPSLFERIENASQFMDDRAVDTQDAASLVPESILDKVGMKRQQYIAENLTQRVIWKAVRTFEFDVFSKLMRYQSNLTRYPALVKTFCDNPVYSLQLPEKEKWENTVEYPFTEEAQTLVLEYLQGLEDCDLLRDLKQNGSDIKEYTYGGQNFSEIDKALYAHKIYMEGLHAKILDFDTQQFMYLYQHSKDKDGLLLMYLNLFYSKNSIDELQPMYNIVINIYEQVRNLRSRGRRLSLNPQFENELKQKLLTFFVSYDYEHIGPVYGSEEYGEDNKYIGEYLAEWQKLSSEGSIHSDGSATIQLLVDAYGINHYIYEREKRRWNERVNSIILGKDNEFDHEKEASEVTEDLVWDDSLETILPEEKNHYINLDEMLLPKKKQKMGKMIPVASMKQDDDCCDYILAADNGDAVAMRKLAYYFIDQPICAKEWFQKAADLGDSESWDRLGSAYQYGAGVVPSNRKAVDCYKKSIVIDGNSDGLLDLGCCYLNGSGVPKNEERGFSLILRSAKQGNMIAQYNLGHIFRNGTFVAPDPEKSLYWFRLSASQDYAPAKSVLKKLEG